MAIPKMHTDGIDIDAALVRRLLAAQFPKWANLTVELAAAHGTDNVIYRLGTELCVRLPRAEHTASRIDKECTWMPRLAPQLPIAVPVPLGKGTPSAEYPYPWSICPWFDGENPTPDNIDDLGQMATDLGQFVAAMQKIDATDGPPAKRGRPLQVRDPETRPAIAALGDTIDTNLATAAWESALATPAWQGRPTWIHGDIHAANLLVSRGKLSAVLDFGSSGVGDPACDMMVAWTLLTAETRNIFRAAVQVDDATWQRGRGWALTFGLVALPYYRESNPILASIALSTINEALADYT